MNGITYESAALLLRYLFLPLGVFIALYAAYMTVVDAMRASFVRAREAETGILARLEYRNRRGECVKASLMKEGSVGSGRKADIRLYTPEVEKKHFYYEIQDGGLFITPLDGPLTAEGKEVTEGAEIRPGSVFLAGDAEIRYTLIKIPTPPVSPTTRRFYGETLKKIMIKKKK